MEITFDSISDWVALVDLEARILRTNLAGEEFVGMPVSDMIGKKCCTLMHGSEEPLPWCPFRRMLNSNQRETVEFEVDDKDRWLMITVDPVMDTPVSTVCARKTPSGTAVTEWQTSGRTVLRSRRCSGSFPAAGNSSSDGTGFTPRRPRIDSPMWPISKAIVCMSVSMIDVRR